MTNKRSAMGLSPEQAQDDPEALPDLGQELVNEFLRSNRQALVEELVSTGSIECSVLQSALWEWASEELRKVVGWGTALLKRPAVCWNCKQSVSWPMPRDLCECGVHLVLPPQIALAPSVCQEGKGCCISRDSSACEAYDFEHRDEGAGMPLASEGAAKNLPAEGEGQEQDQDEDQGHFPDSLLPDAAPRLAGPVAAAALPATSPTVAELILDLVKKYLITTDSAEVWVNASGVHSRPAVDLTIRDSDSTGTATAAIANLLWKPPADQPFADLKSSCLAVEALRPGKTLLRRTEGDGRRMHDCPREGSLFAARFRMTRSDLGDLKQLLKELPMPEDINLRVHVF